jgi:hypothetical protein
MSVQFTTREAVRALKAPVTPAPAKPKKKYNGNTKARPVPFGIDQPGRLRVGHLLTLLGGICPATFYKRLNAGDVPPPDGRNPRPYWMTSTIREYLQKEKGTP